MYPARLEFSADSDESPHKHHELLLLFTMFIVGKILNTG
jgi:hypothetical protein